MLAKEGRVLGFNLEDVAEKHSSIHLVADPLEAHGGTQGERMDGGLELTAATLAELVPS
jgi:hypothetical protein